MNAPTWIKPLVTQERVSAVAAAHGITANGYPVPLKGASVPPPPHVEEVNRSVIALTALLENTRDIGIFTGTSWGRLNRRHTTYLWKHLVERWWGWAMHGGNAYVSNGAFITACLLMGIHIKQIEGSTNGYVALPEPLVRAFETASRLAETAYRIASTGRH